MRQHSANLTCLLNTLFLFLAWMIVPIGSSAADKLVALYSAHAVPYAMPWVADELGLFKKYDIDFAFVYIPSSSTATSAILGNNVEVGLLGGVGHCQCLRQRRDGLGVHRQHQEHHDAKRAGKTGYYTLEQLKGKRIGVTRIGNNTHFFTVQAFRRAGMNPDKDITFIQTGGEAETLGALVSGRIDAATLLPPSDSRAIAQGFRYVVSGPDIAIPYAASTIATRRSIIAKRTFVIGRFMRAMAEASKSMHKDKELVYRVMEKQLRIKDRAILDASYAIEMKVMESRLELRAQAIQPMIEEVARTNPRANEIKPQELMERRYLAEMESSGFFGQVWGEKR